MKLNHNNESLLGRYKDLGTGDQLCIAIVLLSSLSLKTYRRYQNVGDPMTFW